MIINTVILFLRDLLPVFILLCYLKVIFNQQTLSRQFWLVAIGLGLVGDLLFFNAAEVLSDWFEGAGMEVLRAILLIVTYVCLLISVSMQSSNRHPTSVFTIVATTGIAAFITLKCSGFLIFFDVYIQQKDNMLNVIIGCLIGAGICISFSALFVYFLSELKHNRQLTWVLVLWYLFIAGQVSELVVYLSQVDLIVIGAPVFQMGDIIKDSSEYGHILNALVGYEESPSKALLVVYVIAFMIPLLVRYFVSKKAVHHHKALAHE
ncbi:hypothetical protein [Colwellia sp. MEBiC06753]